MANSLHEQLLKSGLIDDKQLKKSKRNKYKKQKQQRRGKTAEVDETKLAAQRAKEEKTRHDRHLNRERNEQAERAAIAAQVRQLIEMNRLPKDDGEVAYNFVDQNKITRIYVTENVHQQLSQSRLAIVKLDEQYELVPSDVAEKIRLRDEQCVILCGAQEKLSANDDPYADYKVPDDLMW